MKYVTAVVTFVLVVVPIMAQSPVINAKHLEKLSKKASECVEITISGTVLRLALRAVKSEDPELYKAVKDSLGGVYIRLLEFDEEGQYSQEDIEIIKRQIKMPPWECIIQAKNKNSEDVGVYILGDSKKDIIKGLIILIAEKKELGFINIVGNIDLEKLDMLSGNFGIPKKDYKKLENKKQQQEEDSDSAETFS
ncbi:MAG: DUF4252 domain-containing protein [Holophagaceae bacterium]|nr:DUF4252 domain-containing protein [Holophagaceae bacterium]